MNRWLDSVRQLQRDGEACVLVTVAGTRGSTPREIGAKMVVTASYTTGTIGGGRLEYKCVQDASKWLREASRAGADTAGRSLLRHFALGANCGQCCGGVADVLFEEIIPGQSQWIQHLGELRDRGIAATLVTPRDSRNVASKLIVTCDAWRSFGADAEVVPNAQTLAMAREVLEKSSARQANTGDASVLLEPVCDSAFNIVIFGAGHVGSACATVLSLLDCQIQLVDSRKGFVEHRWPDNVNALEAADPLHIVSCAPTNSHFLIMTHDHALDLEICAGVLQRQDYASCGLIGSRSKRRRFEKRLRALGLCEEDLQRLTCPIGIDSIHGKRPAEIAIAVAAQLQALHESGADAGVHSPAHRKKDYGRVYR